MEALWGKNNCFRGSFAPTIVLFLPPVPPFLLTQNQSPKDIAGSDIAKSLMTGYEDIGG